MGCGTSSYPVDSTADEDPNKNKKLVERFNYKEHQESKDAVPQMQEKVVQNKQVPSQPQEKLDISETSHQTEHEQSGDKFASNKIQKDKNIVAAAKDESNKSNKASSTEEVPQVKPSQGDSCTDANYAPTVITQNGNGDSVHNKDVSQSNTDLEDLETPHNESADLTLIQATAAKASALDININKNPSIDGNSQKEKELTLKMYAQDEMNVCVNQSVSTPSDKEIDGSPGTPEKSKQKIAPTNGAAETAAEMSAFLVAGDCHAAENQLDPVCEVGDQQLGPGVNANQEEIMNEMALDQGQVSQTSCTVAGDLDQTVNLNLNQNQNQDELRQESTDETIVEVGGEKSSDGCKRSPDVMTETTSRQPDQIDAHEKSSESTLNSTSPEQQTNSHENNESAEGSQPQMKNSGSSVTVADSLDQTVNNLGGNQNRKSTDKFAIEVNSAKSSDEYESNPDVIQTTSPQSDQTSPEASVADPLQIGAQEKNSESTPRCASPHQQQTSLSENYESIEAIPCGEESHPKVKNPDSTISVTNEVKNNKTENIELFPSRDKNAENRLIKALRLSCKLSPGHLVQGLDVRGVMSVHLMRSLSPGVLTVAELVRKLVHLTELDLSGNLLGPQGFRVICLALRRNTPLKCLNLANNLADTDSSECVGLMLSANSTLERLDVSGNNLGSDYFSRCVGPALRTNKSLKALKFSSCASSDVSAICEAMAEDNATIEEVDASNNHIGAVFGEGLSRILQKPGCCLRHLDVHGTNLGKEGMTSLLTGIQQNSSLVSLNAAGHQVPCLSFLMEFLYSCICHPTLQELVLENTKVLELDEWQPKADVSASERSSNLTKLQLSGCSLTNQALQTLSEKTRGKLSCLAHLELSSNDQLTTECLSSVYTMISSPGQSWLLSVLDFSLNAADNIAVDIEKLPELRNLKSLLLKKCRITPASIADLSKLITMATPDFLPISSLTLDGIKLSGTDALKDMLGLSDLFIPTNPCRLEVLSLVGCGLNDRDVKPLMSAICNGVVIKELRLSANRLTDTAVNYLVDSCGTSLSLQALDLSINKIRNGGAEKLAEALSNKLANLQSLLLADNCIGKAGILALVSKIGPASQLAVLNIKSQQQAIGEEDLDEIMEQLAKSVGFDPENSEVCAPDFNLPANLTINLTGLGGEPGELGPKLDSQAILTDYSAKHRRTLTLEDALQLSAVLSHSEDTRAKMGQSDWDRVISTDKDAPTWLQLPSHRECAVYISNLPLSVTAEKLEGQLDSEAECNVMEVYLLKDQILRKPNGLAWVLFTDTESVQRAVEYYNSGQAFMYGTAFVISSVTVDVIANASTGDEAGNRARQEMIQRAEDRKADQTAHAQLVQSNYDESLARHEYAAQHPAYADGRVW